MKNKEDTKAKDIAVLMMAGKGERLLSSLQVKKQFFKLDGKELFLYPLETLALSECFKSILLVVSPEDKEKVSEIVGEYIYSYDDEDLHQVVGKKLIERNITVSACESCTGGRFAEKLVSVPGISAVFDRGLVTYTERAKIEELSVRRETLQEYTAESREVALEMVRGLKEKTGSRLCISVTGVAGPDAMGEKPAGLIYIAVSFDGREDVRVLNTGKSDRQANRNAAVLHMFDLINKTIG